MIVILLLFIILLALSALFSGAETAYFNLKTHRNDIPLIIQKLLKKPRRLLVSFLTGNTIVNIALASLATFITLELAEKNNLNQVALVIMQIFLVTFIILIFGEVIPKLMAIRNSVFFARKAFIPIRILVYLIYCCFIFSVTA